MVGIVIVTHYGLGEEYVKTTELIVGKLRQLTAVCTTPDEGVEQIRERILAAMKDVDRGEGVLILTDMFGGTPSNISLSFLSDDKVEVLTGVNLPMLIALATHRQGKSLKELAEFLKGYGQRNISLASEVLQKKVPRR